MLDSYPLADFIPSEFLWVFALALAFGLSILITVLIDGNEMAFLSLFMIFMGFCAWGGLIEGWVFIAVFVGYIILIIYEIKFKENG